MEKIKYTLYIKQLGFYRAGFAGKIDLDEIALLEVINAWEDQEKSLRIKDMAWIDFSTVIQQLPFCRSLRSKAGVSRAIKRLSDLGLVETQRGEKGRLHAKTTKLFKDIKKQPVRSHHATAGGTVSAQAQVSTPVAERRQHSFPQAWQHAAVLDSLLVDLAPAAADAVVLLTVAAHMKGRAMSVVAYAASLARSARDGRLDLTTLSAVSSKVTELTRTDRHPQARGDDPAREVGKCAESFRQKILDARKSAGI